MGGEGLGLLLRKRSVSSACFILDRVELESEAGPPTPVSYHKGKQL